MSDRTSVQHRDEAAVRAILERIAALWAEVASGRASADAIAALFTEDASFVAGDGAYLRGRSQIAAYFRHMVEGQDAHGVSIKGATVVAEADSVRFLDDGVAVMVGRGGILFPGELVVPPERRGIQTAVMTRGDGKWLTAAYQNTRSLPRPDAG